MKLQKYLKSDQISFLDKEIVQELQQREIINIPPLREKIFFFLKVKFNIELLYYLDMDRYLFKFNKEFDNEVKTIDKFINNLVRYQPLCRIHGL